MAYLLLFLGIYALYIASSAVSLAINYRRALQTGLPIVVNPIDHTNLVWMIFSPRFQKLASRHLPTFLYRLIWPGILGWDFTDGWEPFKDIKSPTFVYVSPGGAKINCADPEFLNQVWAWKTGFDLELIGKKLLGIHGPSMLTSSGPDWQRQRRTIAPLLNESISEVVWDTSYRQAREMLTDIETRGDLVSNTVIAGLKTIAINVLGAAGYGIQKPWVASVAEKSETSISSSFFNSISIQAQGFILAALIPIFVLKMPFVSQALRKLAVAKRDFPQYAKGMIQFERAQQAEKSIRKNSFIGMLVKELDGKEPTSESESVQKKSALTPLEVQGNLFVFSIAGYETTANSMAFAVVYLAAYPQWQDWLIEEIDSVAKGNSEHTYEQTFSKLVRCLAFMFEITRIYSPVGRTSRVVTADQYVILSSGRTHKIPSGLGIAFSNQGVHLNPSIYGPDPSLFHPQRWLYDTPGAEGQPLQQTLVNPPKGTYLVWSGGPRQCPGMKMAQVEFVSVIYTILKKYRISAVIRDSRDTMDQAREKLADCMRDSRQKFILEMSRPQDVWLEWKTRQ